MSSAHLQLKNAFFKDSEIPVVAGNNAQYDEIYATEYIADSDEDDKTYETEYIKSCLLTSLISTSFVPAANNQNKTNIKKNKTSNTFEVNGVKLPSIELLPHFLRTEKNKNDFLQDDDLLSITFSEDEDSCEDIKNTLSNLISSVSISLVPNKVALEDQFTSEDKGVELASLQMLKNSLKIECLENEIMEDLKLPDAIQDYQLCKLEKLSKKIKLNPLKYSKRNGECSDGSESGELMKEVADFKGNLFLRNLLCAFKQPDLSHNELDIFKLNAIKFDVSDDKINRIPLGSDILNSDLNLTHKHKKSVEEIMRKSVLTNDLEKKSCAPKMFELNNSKQLKRKKDDKFLKTQSNVEIKSDMNFLKMKNFIDPENFYKQNNLYNFNKYFHVGAIYEGSYDFSNSKHIAKKKKTEMNGKTYFQHKKKKLCELKHNRSKFIWART